MAKAPKEGETNEGDPPEDKDLPPTPPSDPRVDECLAAIKTIQASLSEQDKALKSLQEKKPEDERIPALQAKLDQTRAILAKWRRKGRFLVEEVQERTRQRKSADDPPDQKRKTEPRKTHLGLTVL